MANVTYPGSKAIAYESARGALVEGDGIAELDPNAWYEVAAFAAAGSQLPGGAISLVFRTPDTGETAITPIAGDDVYPLTLTRICKTDAEVTFEEGTIDTTDDCGAGFTQEILDGFKKISGTLNGFAKFDDATQTLATETLALFGRFINNITDDGAGTYVVTDADNAPFILFILLNKDAAVDDILNYIICPAIITGLAAGAGLKDAQKRDLTWTKSEGYVSLYQRIAFAADLP